MPRLTKKAVVLAKIETTYGTDAVPTGAANAIQVFDLSIDPLETKNVTINAITPWLGGQQELVATVNKKCSFSVLMGGSGTAATAPAWGALLVACASSETTGLLTPNRVEYLPATDTLKSLTIYYYDDGLLHKLTGCFGNVKLSAKSGDVAKLTFDFVGVDSGDTVAANATAVLTAWKVPPSIVKANVTDITLGSTYAAGVLTGGTAYNSTGITLDWGNTVNFTPMLTTEQVVLGDRDIKGSITLDLTAAQEVALIASIKANTTQGLGFVLGTTTGNKIMLHAPGVQLVKTKKEEVNGMRLIGYDIRLNYVAGNDEIRLISL